MATRYGLAPSLVCAVCEQESDWNCGAVRFEPGFLKRYVDPLNLYLLESLDRSTSWGLMQIMGQTAIEFGWPLKVAPLTDLRDPTQGLQFGCKKLQNCFLKHGGNRESALLAYNGGSNPNYPAEVIARIQHYTNV